MELSRGVRARRKAIKHRLVQCVSVPLFDIEVLGLLPVVVCCCGVCIVALERKARPFFKTFSTMCKLELYTASTSKVSRGRIVVVASRLWCCGKSILNSAQIFAVHFKLAVQTFIHHGRDLRVTL